MEIYDLLIRLIFAHLVGDFILQPSKWVQHKHSKKLKSGYLYLHCLIHGALVIILTCDFHEWDLALKVIVGHFIIDALKVLFHKKERGRTLFFFDQVAHVVFLTALWYHSKSFEFVLTCNVPPEVLIVLGSIVFLTMPSSIVTRLFISRWTVTNDNREQSSNHERNEKFRSLESAGSVIGIFERLFVFAFILLGSYQAIGFLFAAKSIFRFGDLKEDGLKMTEYVLIGTLTSFGIAFATGLGCKYLLAL